MDWATIIFWLNISGALVLFVLYAWRWIWPESLPQEAKLHIGEITADALQYYCGYDYMKPILVAVK